MKLNLNVLAAAIVSSVVVLSAAAQHVPVRDGSNSSRALLPSNRPNDFVRIVRTPANAFAPAQFALAADHLGGRQELKDRAVALEAAQITREQQAAARAVAVAQANAARIAASTQ
jgi:hypothetical protein